MKNDNFEDIKYLASSLRVLGHPDRLRILACLTKHKCFVNEIAGRLSLSQSAVSQHLRVMADAGILSRKRDGVKVCYNIDGRIAKAISSLIDKFCEK